METTIANVLWLIPALPLAGTLFNLFLGRRLPRVFVSFVGVGVIAGSFSVSAFIASSVLNGGGPFQQELFPWIVAGTLNVSLSLLVDQLSMVMVLVVSGVGLLIHLYSVGYMGHDSSYSRFFTYLNLFTFSMLLLVMADNFLVMFVGWELVGLCSFLLIGFWFERPAAASAGKKAFVTNRVGDLAFIVGLFLIFTTFGSFDFNAVLQHPEQFLNEGGLVATAITMLLFVGATGKSAQVPLYVWLPDAMEGPTPVSALIHAATMVTAGVYMVVRASTLYLLAPATMTTIAIIGALTAVFAATIALTQTDIKRVLAYSTVSQLGFMFLAAGVGAFGAAIFHLMTHAFFKALLFLGAGSVIHALHEEQDLRRMGGLLRHLPLTGVTMIVAWLSIIGFPGLAGFWSKDLILARTFEGGHLWLWIIGIITTALTSFYMSRLIFLTFFGESRTGDSRTPRPATPHEGPLAMAVALVVLAVLAVVGGFAGIPGSEGTAFERFLEPILGGHGAEHVAMGFSLSETTLAVIAVGAGGIGALLAGAVYLLGSPSSGLLARVFAPFYRISINKYWIDELYEAILINPCARLAAFFASFDLALIDGTVNGTGRFLRGTAAILGTVQGGYVRSYAIAFVLGTIAILTIWIFR